MEVSCMVRRSIAGCAFLEAFGSMIYLRASRRVQLILLHLCFLSARIRSRCFQSDSFLRWHTYFGLVYRYFFPGVRTLLYYTVLYFTGGRYRIAFVPSMLLDVLYLSFVTESLSGSVTELGCSCVPNWRLGKPAFAALATLE